MSICVMSDGGGGSATGSVDLEFCPCGGSHSWLVPAMLSPPESLLMSCIRRGNFMEAHQVCPFQHFRCELTGPVESTRVWICGCSAGVRGVQPGSCLLLWRAGLHGALQRSPGGAGTGGAEDGEPVNVVLLILLGGFGVGSCDGRREDSAGQQRSVNAAGHRKCCCCRSA